MTRAAAVAFVVGALAGCIDDHYTCYVDSDCDLGAGGRCELDGHCTVYDPTCTLDRRYTAHSGAQSNACFDDAIAPMDKCAAGQPPSPKGDSCAATVCTALPACCNTGWSDACVALAQVHCGLTCDARIALVVQHGTYANPGPPELWDLRYTPGQAQPWTERLRRDNAPGNMLRSKFLGWLAPAHGATQPRLVGLDAGGANLVVGEGASPLVLPVATDRHWDSIASVDFDRDGRDKAVLLSYDAADQISDDVYDLAAGTVHPLPAVASGAAQVWGDYDGDAFPDPVAAAGASTTYRLLQNDADGNTERRIVSGVDAYTTQGDDPQVRGFDWADLDGNGRLDLVQYGSSVAIHYATNPIISDQASLRIDCDPPTKLGSATCMNQDTNIALAGAVVAGPGNPTLVVSTIAKLSPKLAVYRLKFSTPTSFVATPIAIDAKCTGCAVEAIVARDLDNDGMLDLVAIDSSLNVYVALAKVDPNHLVFAFTLGTQLVTPIPIIRTSVSGAAL